MPEKNPLVINADFSDIQVGETYGPVEIHSEYSKIKLDRLHHESNVITGKYNSRGKIGFARKLTLESDYSDWTMDLGFEVNARLNYTKFMVHRVKNIYLQGEYNDIFIHRAKNLNAELEDSKLGVEKLYRLKWKGDYNKIQIERLTPLFRLIQTEGDYNHVVIRNPEQTPYTFKFILTYGKVSFPDQTGMVILQKQNLSDKVYYEGYFLKPNAEGSIRMNLKHSYIIINNKTQNDEKN